MNAENKMKCGGTSVLAIIAVMAAVNVHAAVDSRVEFRECPKCDKRIKIDLSANKAYVNLSRMEGASREKLAARAAMLLDAAKIPPAADPKIRPLMGWSSWNTFGAGITEAVILETARAMATNGLKEAGYVYVNIDDGFQDGHDKDGNLKFHKERFPNGLKPVIDGIRALGLKGGIYSDAGADTCNSADGDPTGLGSGLYGHDAADCKLHFIDLGFDFIKVDWCGGRKLKLDKKQRYTEIANAIKATGRNDVRFNICCWAFPGTWAADIAESWRTTGDIRANWNSIRRLIGINLYYSAYAKPGHYNDMDMLEVGQLAGKMKTVFGKRGDVGLTPAEELTHFGMWCMLSSPLLIGCDVRTIPESTLKVITNPYLLAVNQNDLGCQAYVAQRDGGAYVLVKDAYERFGTSRYVALYNSTDKEQELAVSSEALDLGGLIDVFDLVEQGDIGCFEKTVHVKVPPRSSKFYRFDAERRLVRKVYEAETAYLTDYQATSNPVKAGTAHCSSFNGASGGVLARYLGKRPSNDLIWKEVQVDEAGEYMLSFDYFSSSDREFDLTVNTGMPVRVSTPATKINNVDYIKTVSVRVKLNAGINTVRLSNDANWMPDIDKMIIVKLSKEK